MPSPEPADQGAAPAVHEVQASPAEGLKGFAEPRSLTEGIELNLTGPIALRFALTVPGQQSCKLSVGTEYRTAGQGLSYMAIHQKESGTSTGQGMDRQDTAVHAGPIDNREGAGSAPGSSRITWSARSGDSTLTMVVLFAEANDSDSVANGSVFVQSTCDGSLVHLLEAGSEVTTWHAQTLNGTAMLSHEGMGLAIDRSIQATFAAARTLMAASHAGEAVGQISFRGPGTEETMRLPLERIAVADGGPGTYETHANVVAGTDVWGFMAGLGPVPA